MKKIKKKDPRFCGGIFYSRWAPYAMLVPAMAAFIAFRIWPFARNFYLSTYVTDMLGNPGKYVGLANYERVLQSEDFWISLSATLKFAAIVGVGSFALSMLMALLCVDMEKGGKVYQTMFAIPMAIATAPISAIFVFILSRYGLLNALLGTETVWLNDASVTIWMVAFITIWAGSASGFLYLLVGFRNVPDELVEAATLDGATFWKRVRSIYIPIASPQIFFVVFLNIIGSFQAFGFIKQLVGVGPAKTTNVLVYAMYELAFTRSRFETACVYAIALFLVIFVVTRIQLLCEKRLVFYQ